MIWRGSSVDLSRARPSRFPRARLASAHRRWHSYAGATRDRRDTFLPVSRLLALPRVTFALRWRKGCCPAQPEQRVTGFGPRPWPLTSRIPPASLDAFPSIPVRALPLPLSPSSSFPTFLLFLRFPWFASPRHRFPCFAARLPLAFFSLRTLSLPWPFSPAPLTFSLPLRWVL